MACDARYAVMLCDGDANEYPAGLPRRAMRRDAQ